MANHKLVIDPNGRNCSKCNKFLPWDEFNASASGPNGKASSCRKCKTSCQRAAYSDIQSIKACCRLHGLDIADTLAAFEAHDGMCDICRIRTARRLNIDHDHSNGKRRGFLCTVCNTRLAVLEDKSWVDKATIYLERYS